MYIHCQIYKEAFHLENFNESLLQKEVCQRCQYPDKNKCVEIFELKEFEKEKELEKAKNQNTNKEIEIYKPSKLQNMLTTISIAERLKEQMSLYKNPNESWDTFIFHLINICDNYIKNTKEQKPNITPKIFYPYEPFSHIKIKKETHFRIITNLKVDQIYPTKSDKFLPIERMETISQFLERVFNCYLKNKV